MKAFSERSQNLGNCLIAFVLLLAISAARAQNAVPAGQNLALGKSYKLDPAPNYSYCTDPGDSTQLTDGQRVSGYFWTQRGTVGWANVRPVLITIDLGSVQPISGVSFNTAAGTAGVEWPQTISVLASDDGETYHLAGDLVQLSAKTSQAPTNGYALHCFETHQLKTHGRYVAFVVNPSGPFTFTDEIEVYKGPDELLKLPAQGVTVSDLSGFFLRNQTRNGFERRLRQDLRKVQDTANKLAPSVKNECLAGTTNFEQELLELPLPSEKDSRVVLPLNGTHQRVFQAQARVWRALQTAPFTVWTTNPYSPLSMTQAPPRQSEPGLSVSMMQNETRAAVFNIANATDSAALASMEIVGLPGGTDPAFIKVSEVAWTDTSKGLPIAAALPELSKQNNHFSVKVFPGLTKQVWLTFYTTNVSADSYKGSVLLSIGNTNLTIPLELRVYPMRFPDAPTLHLGGWDYTDADQFSIGASNRNVVIEHLREHFIDSPWASSPTLALGKYDDAGNMTAEPDTTRFDRWVSRWPNARQYGVFVNGGEQFDNSKAGTAAFNNKVGAWIRFWASHAQKLGIHPEQMVLHLVDEPAQAKQDELILAWASAIHDAHSGVKTWEDTIHKDPSKANQKMMAACDVLCPNRTSFVQADQRYRDYYVKWHDQGKELAFYSCDGPSTLLDPYSYYRLQAWSCWVYGAKSSYFWAFSDAGGGSSWNEYSAKGNTYVPFFLDAASVTPGKQMEAIREGVEDYEYLVMLRNQIASAEESGKKGPDVDNAKRLLTEAAGRVCSAPGANGLNWMDEKDRSVADAVRVEILNTLSALKGGNGS